ncbi:hypothetical protein TEA_016945 [Camellia sinensis var. sinensis]|uniref:Bromo domain-containing protein n=1 Tax=Camellia sinensis var. sinensis TaxID=542762 RepID=A0A4S4EWI0_CAMSN|nr:hypothetical protein TEA_016945 [Camellia sinensis var. sinensis]
MQRTNVVALLSSSDVLSCSNTQNGPSIEKVNPVGDSGTSGRELQEIGRVDFWARKERLQEAWLESWYFRKYGWVFNTPVDVVKLNIPDYLTIIKHPMDLGTIKSKIASSEYLSVLEFVADVRLTFSNAMTYNPPGNDFHIIADTLSKFFEARWKVIANKLLKDSQPLPEKLDVHGEKGTIKPMPPSKKRKLTSPQHKAMPGRAKRIMTYEEKHKLSRDFEALLGELPDNIFEFLLDDYLREIRKNQAKAEPCEIEVLNGSWLSDLSMQFLCRDRWFKSHLFYLLFCGTSKDLKRLLDLPIQKRKAPLVLNFIPTYKSTLPDVPKRKKKSLSPPTATTQTASTSRTDQESTSDPTNQPSTSASYLIPIPERKRRRRLIKTAEMGRPKPVAVDLLADLPADVGAVPTQSMPPPKPKRTKRAQPKAKVTQVESEDALPISKLAESKKTSSAPAKRMEFKNENIFISKITLEDRPIMSSESADDINVGVALSTALLLLGDLERNAEYSEYENYALMLQHSVQAIQHAHSFSMQAFENRAKLVDLKREVSALKKENKSLQLKMKKLEDQAEAATKAQTLVEEKAESAEAIRKVAEAEKRDAEDKKAQAEKELQDALSTKDAEIKAADEKAYAQDADEEEDEALVRKSKDANGAKSPPQNEQVLDLTHEENEDVIKETTPEQASSNVPPINRSLDQTLVGGFSLDADEEEDEALVRKSKDANGAKSPHQNEQVLDLTHEEDEDVIKETTPEQASSDVPPINKSLDQTLVEIDAKIAADEEAEVSLQETSEVQIQPDADVEKS